MDDPVMVGTYHHNVAGIIILADAHGADHPIVKDAKCPFSVYAHCDGCALNNDGCAIVRLAAATNNK